MAIIIQFSFFFCWTLSRYANDLVLPPLFNGTPAPLTSQKKKKRRKIEGWLLVTQGTALRRRWLASGAALVDVPAKEKVDNFDRLDANGHQRGGRGRSFMFKTCQSYKKRRWMLSAFCGRCWTARQSCWRADLRQRRSFLLLPLITDASLILVLCHLTSLLLLLLFIFSGAAASLFLDKILFFFSKMAYSSPVRLLHCSVATLTWVTATCYIMTAAKLPALDTCSIAHAVIGASYCCNHVFMERVRLIQYWVLPM